MFTIRFFGIICFSASVYAQFSGPSGTSITGEVRASGNQASSDYLVEVYDARTNMVIERAPVNHGEFELNRVPAGSYTVRVVTAQGGVPVVEESHRFEMGTESLVLTLPESKANQPISGLVSLHELEHPVSKKALREAYDAQQFVRENNIPKAIAKLEKAILIDPSFRDAHLNLGVQYARTGRTAEAKAEFGKALEIGPPAAPIYADLALASLNLKQFRDAEAFARKALALEPTNTSAQRVLQYATQH